MQFSSQVQLGILGLLIFQCLFFSAFLFTQIRKEKKSNLYLAMLLAVLGLHMFMNLMSSVGIDFANPKFVIGLSALYGPLIYLHIIALQRQKFEFHKIQLLHFALSPLAVLLSNLGIEFVEMAIRVVVLLQVYTYLVLGMFSIKRFQNIIRFTQSRYESINLNWAYYLLSSFLLIALVDLISNIFNFYSLVNNEWVFNILLLVILIFVNTLFFKGLMQPKLFLGISANDDQVYADEIHKYSNSSVTPKQLWDTQKKIEVAVATSKPYLNPDLSLETFSSQLNLSLRLVSQTINTQFKTNFSDYINDLRIEDAKQLLKGENNLNVLEILFEVGFNSKSAFYEHFKKKTGLTPNQFKKS